jgi:hypothetical protein
MLSLTRFGHAGAHALPSHVCESRGIRLSRGEAYGNGICLDGYRTVFDCFLIVFRDGRRGFKGGASSESRRRGLCAAS